MKLKWNNSKKKIMVMMTAITVLSISSASVITSNAANAIDNAGGGFVRRTRDYADSPVRLVNESRAISDALDNVKNGDPRYKSKIRLVNEFKAISDALNEVDKAYEKKANNKGTTKTNTSSNKKTYENQQNTTTSQESSNTTQGTTNTTTVTSTTTSGSTTTTVTSNTTSGSTTTTVTSNTYSVKDSYGNVIYILANSDSKYYTATELQSLSKEQLRLARNEIFAKKGAKFQSADLQQYFGSRSWYNPIRNSSEFTDADFNTYEMANIRLIQSLE